MKQARKDYIKCNTNETLRKALNKFSMLYNANYDFDSTSAIQDIVDNEDESDRTQWNFNVNLPPEQLTKLKMGITYINYAIEQFDEVDKYINNL